MTFNDPEFRKLLDAYLNGKATPQEQELLNKFYASYENDLAREDLGQDQAQTGDKIFAGVTARIHKRHFRAKLYTRYLPVAAAVSLLIVVLSFFLNENPPVQSETTSVVQHVRFTRDGQKLSLKLSDGTQVKLNAGSAIQFPEQFTGTTREVTLFGEAYFEVESDPDKPFVVHTEQARTTVVGTTFNIKALQGSSTEVTLVEGKVRVASAFNAGGRAVEITLKPNQQAIVETGSSTITTRKIDAQRLVAWKDNVLEFENTSLDKAVEKLKRWYGVHIELTGNSRLACTINATYRNESLENVLKSFEFILKITYTVKDGKIIIDSKNCQ